MSQAFSCKFCEIFKNIFFKRTVPVPASKSVCKLIYFLNAAEKHIVIIIDIIITIIIIIIIIIIILRFIASGDCLVLYNKLNKIN